MIIGWCVVAVLGLLAASEVARFRMARGASQLPYPASRLIRRLVIAALLAGSMILALYWPAHRLATHLLCLGAVLLALPTAMVLLWIDLRQTSLEVLIHARQEQAGAGEALESWLREQKAGAGTPSGDAPPPEPPK